MEKEGRPEIVESLAAEVKSADGVIIVTPKYNNGLSGVLKNAFDWASRLLGGVWKDKPVAVMTAARGLTGGETAQYMLRACITPFDPRLITAPVIYLEQEGDQIDHNGLLTAAKYLTSVTALMAALRGEITLKTA